MTTSNLYYNIKEAFETSTHNCNRFSELLNRINWDSSFFADEEFYFIKDDLTICTPSLDPFAMKWGASAIFKDGAVLSIA